MLMKVLRCNIAWSFWGLLAVAVLATALLGELAFRIGRSVTPYPLWLELLAWLCITCTYIGFTPAEFLLGPRKGLTRLLDQRWATPRLYLAVYSGILGAILGLSLLAAPLHNHIVLKVFSLVLVFYHFVLRHFTTEPKGTPHLGQRGSDQERTIEVLLGQLGDVYLLLILFVIWWLTKHPIWLLGTAILLAGYILGVWIHRRWDPKPRSLSSYLGTLGCLVVMSVAVLVLGFETDVPNLLCQVEVALALIGVVVLLDRQPYVAALVAVTGLVLATVYGLLVGQERIVTGFSELLLNPTTDWRNIRDYWVLLAVVSFAANTAFSRVLELLLGERNRP